MPLGDDNNPGPWPMEAPKSAKVERMTDETLTAIEARLNLATPGPWWVERDGENDTTHLVGADNTEIAQLPFYAPFRHKGNETFMANAVTDIATLLAEVRRLRAVTQ